MSSRRVLLLAIVTLVVSAVGAATASAAGVTVAPVKFRVKNSNRSKVFCQGNDAEYTVRGKIIAPKGVLAHTVPAAALYVHGLGETGTFWHYTRVKGYDLTGSLAKKGLVSVVIDRLGYGSSGRPPGRNVCYGSEADYLNQIVLQLQNRAYTMRLHRLRAPKIQRVALASHNASGFAAQAEAYSFGHISGLMIFSFGDNSLSVKGVNAGNRTDQICTAGQQDYAYFGQSAQEYLDTYVGADPRITSFGLAHRPLDPCGDVASAPSGIMADDVNLRTVSVPVLLVTGQQDEYFQQHTAGAQAKLFGGSKDVTPVELAGTGQQITLGRTATTFQRTVADWLLKRNYKATKR